MIGDCLASSGGLSARRRKPLPCEGHHEGARHVTLRNGVLDPQGKAIEGALGSMGIAGIEGVRQGKIFDIALKPGLDRAAAEAMLRTACEKLLANTVVENFAIEIIA